ncbi:MAG: iron-sulfur cluster insertion protein ErpA [Pseudomonadales bacterium]
MQANIGFSEQAAHRVRQLIVDEGNDSLKLRVFVAGGGCSGFSYGFTFDDEVAVDDAVVERAGITLLVDSLSYQYLLGSEIDYVEDLQGAQFIVTNPNAASTCGCGNSFAI